MRLKRVVSNGCQGGQSKAEIEAPHGRTVGVRDNER